MKGTVSVISSLQSMQRWKYPIYNCTLKSIVGSSTNKISMFKYLKTDYVRLWLLQKSVLRAFFLQENKSELSEINTFKPRKTTISSTLLIRKRFQVYLCESGIANFARWYNRNYAYSIFKVESIPYSRLLSLII